MIPKHIERKPGRDNYRALALYAADAKTHGETGEKTLMSWHEGCMAEDYLGGIIEVEATQAMNTRTTKEKTYHLMVSFRPEDESKLTPEIFKDIEKELAQAIGFSGHQRHCGVHKNTDNIHMHIAYNIIEPETFNRRAPFYDHQKLHRACRELEKKYGLAIDRGMGEARQKNAPKKHTKAETIEAQTGQQSFFNFVSVQKKEILQILEQTENWAVIHNKFLQIGLEIQPRGSGLIIKDRFGKHAVKASDIDRCLSKSQMEKKYGQFIGVKPEQAASVQSEKNYCAAPLHQDLQRDNLYTNFQAGLNQRKTALEAVKENEAVAYKSTKSRWDEKRKMIEGHAMLPTHKRQLLQIIKAKEDAELAANRLELADQRKSIRESFSYTSWTKFLQHQASQGDEAALKILRSKKIHPELLANSPMDKTYAQFRAEKISKEEQTRILMMKGINQKHRQALLTVVKMNEVIAKNLDSKISDMKYRIDTKGVIIFTFRPDGAIRDTGLEIHYDCRNPHTKKLAQELAFLKWGKQIKTNENVISFASPKIEKSLTR